MDVPNLKIRPYQSSDLEELKRITIEGFEGIAIDQRAEMVVGILSNRDWRWRKARHVDDDVEANPRGVFVAEEDGVVLGYISTRLDHECGKGRIPNLAVDRSVRGRGIGRQLIEHALEYFRSNGMTWAVIETMDNNPIGQHLYPSCGFIETCRQIHFARKL
ncbi:MAG: GNAT family N-acetyltransferase [Pirellula sp.]